MTDSIQLIVVDLDGTLLNSQHTVSERNAKAIRAAGDEGIQVVLATGKTRNSALSVIARLGLNTPGIYLQGLATYNPDGSLRIQSTLDPAIARQVITYTEDRGFTVIAYSGTRILIKAFSKGMELLSKYGEPDAEVVGPLQNILDSTPINKLLAIKLGDHKSINALRWQLNMQINGAARLVQAGIPDMLEILPPGVSKGSALKSLLKEMNISAANVMAIGDGENDIEMLQLAGVGIAMGNALERVKEIANHVVSSNDDNGVAEAIERFALKPKIETPEKPAETPSEPEAKADAKPSAEDQSTQEDTSESVSEVK